MHGEGKWIGAETNGKKTEEFPATSSRYPKIGRD